MSKTKDIEVWMPLYIGDYLSDTARLNTEQHGAYLLIIMDYWKNGAPPDDDAVLSSIAKLTVQAWRKHRPSIAKLFQIEGGEWKHKRIEKELGKATQQSVTAKKRAKAGADARWGNKKADDKALLDECSKDATSIPQAFLDDMLADAPSPSPSPINTLSLNASEYFPSLELVNTKLKMSGQPETTQIELNQILVQFNLKTAHLQMVDNEKLGSLLTWFKNEREPNKSPYRASPAKQRLDFDSVLAKKNQMRDVTPMGVINHEH